MKSIQNQNRRQDFDRLFTSCAPRLRRLLYSKTSDVALIDDIISEAFCRVLRLPNFDPNREDAGGYLATCVIRILTDIWKSPRNQTIEQLSIVVFWESESGGILHDSVGEFESLNERDDLLVAA